MLRLMRLIFMRLAIPGLFLLSQSARAQVNFEVASVKLSTPGQNFGNRLQGGPGTPDPTRFTANNATLSTILTRAFGVPFDQLTGPDWINTLRVDIAATVPSGAARDQLNVTGDHLVAKNRDAAGVAQALRSAAGMRVIDQTGLTGTYDFDLHFGVDRSDGRGPMNCKDVPLDAPGVVEAVQKQLGLKLQKTTAMLDVIVIDHLDKTPVGN